MQQPWQYLAPTSIPITVRSGTKYTPDANQMISGVSSYEDHADLLKAGCEVATWEVGLFGQGSAFFLGQGNINRQISSAGVQPGSTGNDNVLAVYSLPANSLDVLGRGLVITAAGSFGATANNKRVKIIYNATTAVVGSAVTGGTTVADTAVVATNGGGWCLTANVFKYGAAGSNTQLGVHQQAQVGAAVAALVVPTLITAVESGAILIAVCGNATTSASDILFNWLEINAMN